jgi:hypothetical protein
MNREDIIRMAREANLHWYANELNEESFFEIVERFATLVAAAEREECADMADATGDPDLADAIRARGQS